LDGVSCTHVAAHDVVAPLGLAQQLGLKCWLIVQSLLHCCCRLLRLLRCSASWTA
jgi:hypothetical protein